MDKYGEAEKLASQKYTEDGWDTNNNYEQK